MDFSCAECGKGGTGTFVVTVRDAEDGETTRTEVCRECDDLLRGKALFVIQEADVESLLGRPLRAGEASSISKSLDHGLSEELAFVIAAHDNETDTEPYDPHGGEKHRYYEEN